MTFGSVYIAGHRRLVGSALLRDFQKHGYRNIIVRIHDELDLRNTENVRKFFATNKPDAVVVAAARVGGIQADNDLPVEFLLENLQIQNNLISASFDFGVKKLLFLGSSCIPEACGSAYQGRGASDRRSRGNERSVRNRENCRNQALPGLCAPAWRKFHFGHADEPYGPGDNFDLQTSHVLPALIRKVHEAKMQNRRKVVIWGTGTPRREFLHTDDRADALRFLLENYDSPQIINVGCGYDITIRDLALLVANVVGVDAELVFDTSKPDGTPRKLLDISRLRQLGWQPRITLEEGIRDTYQWFLRNSKINQMVHEPRHGSGSTRGEPER